MQLPIIIEICLSGLYRMLCSIIVCGCCRCLNLKLSAFILTLSTQHAPETFEEPEGDGDDAHFIPIHFLMVLD
jgi:hypothetical protein